ncbi:hypothetical protein [Sphingomonas abietis]|uniref:STAS/SEC14 domain-containing protein n=1 Tax=Sphingomonas abietis TaxID=3012344 RepID=A0ABY7NLN9_9SPHN|nr:hypothetical protein [Sphingomonas abietis]WBO21487.1 hypothetical protein PBT88_15035 [Sphingomonas abietis]
MLDGQDDRPDIAASGPPAMPVASQDGAMDVHYDDERRIIRIDCHGVWTPAQVDACFDELKTLIGEMRTRLNRVRVFVDRRLAVPQPMPTVERLKQHVMQEYRPNDRIAVVVDSSLAKMQLRDQLDPQTHKLFLSGHAAATWLSAHD